MRFRQKFSLSWRGVRGECGADRRVACDKKVALEANVLFKVIRTLHTPLRQKYRCFELQLESCSECPLNQSPQMWHPCGQEPLQFIRRDQDNYFADFWPELAELFDNFLFPDSMDEQRQEDRSQDESIDVLIIELPREEVLPFHPAYPQSSSEKLWFY